MREGAGEVDRAGVGGIRGRDGDRPHRPVELWREGRVERPVGAHVRGPAAGLAADRGERPAEVPAARPVRGRGEHLAAGDLGQAADELAGGVQRGA